MCFAKTKTLKSLRNSKNKNNHLDTDLGFNYDDSCDYLTQDLLDTIQSNEHDLKILHLNIRGLKGKLFALSSLLNKRKSPEIIILNETWLKEDDNKRINIPNYKYEGIPRKNRKGGSRLPNLN